MPSETPTVVEAVIVPSATVQLSPTLTETLTVTVSPIPTNTAQPTATVTTTATPTTILPTHTPTASARTQLPVATTIAATKTVQQVTQEITSTATHTPDQTRVVANGVNAITPTPGLIGNNGLPNNGFAPEVLIAGLALIAILVYAVLYWRGISGSERYASGFVIETCPACQRGHLIVESRQERLLGIPRVRHSVRCSECRSIMREVSNEHWRYAVDPIANPDLYQRFNGKIVDNQSLLDMASNRLQTTSQRSASSQSPPPDFIDDDL